MPKACGSSHVKFLGRFLDSVGHEAAAEVISRVATALGGRGERLADAADHVGGAGLTGDRQTA